MREHYSTFVVFFLLVSLLRYGAPALAAAATSEDLIKAVRAAKIVDSDFDLQARIEGDGALITTFRHARATDDDCKIDAVLIARAAIEADSPALKKVTVRFLDASQTAGVTIWSTEVSKEIIDQYKARNINQAALFSLLKMERANEPSAAEQAPARMTNSAGTGAPGGGLLLPERQVAWERIAHLQEKGIAVNRALELYRSVEELAGQNKAAQASMKLVPLQLMLSGLEQSYNRQHAAEVARQLEAADIQMEGVSEPAKVQRIVRELGGRVPQPGPRFEARCKLAYRAKILQGLGFLMPHAESRLSHIERLAGQNNLPELDRQIRELKRRMERYAETSR